MPTESDFHHPHAPRSEPRRERPEFGGAVGVDVSKSGGVPPSKPAQANDKQFDLTTTGGYPGLRNPRSGK